MQNYYYYYHHHHHHHHHVRYVSRLLAKHALNLCANPDTTGSYINSNLGSFDLLLFYQETHQLSSDFLRIISLFFMPVLAAFMFDS